MGESTPASFDVYQARKYIPELDGLRAISVLMVISVHMHDQVWGWLAGWLGVYVFFVLSGYLITMLALREERQRGRLSFGAFYIRRSFRIFPLYYVVLGIYCFLILGIGLNPEKRPLMIGALPWYLLYMQEVPAIYGVDGQKENVPFYQNWSLGIEEKFYLVWPLLVFALWYAHPRLRLVGTIALIIGFALAPYAIPWRQVGNCLQPYYFIVVGCLLALVLEDARGFDRLRFLGIGWWPTVTLLVVLALHFTIPQLPEKSLISYTGVLLYTLAMTAFLASVLLGEGRIQRGLRWAPLVFIGKLSYGIYLIHILCLNVAQRVFPAHTGRIEMSVGALLLAGVLSVAVAWVMSIVIEKPLIEVGRRWSKRVLDREQAARTVPAS